MVNKKSSVTKARAKTTRKKKSKGPRTLQKEARPTGSTRRKKKTTRKKTNGKSNGKSNGSGNGVGRPRIVLTEDQLRLIESAARCGCTQAEAARVVSIHEDTLRDNFSSHYKAGVESRNHALRHAQFEMAVGCQAVFDKDGNELSPARRPNITMLIWLGKQYLGQVDGATEEDIYASLREALKDKPLTFDEFEEKYSDLATTEGTAGSTH